MTYSYDNEGSIIKRTNKDFRSGNKKESEYRYEYKYYE